MNTPVRRVALAVMAMILLLLANLTYVQVVKAAEYRNDPLQPAGCCWPSTPRSAARSPPAGRCWRTASRPTTSCATSGSIPDGPTYAPLTGYYSVIYGASGIEQSEKDVLNGSDDRLFVRRLSDLITGRDPSGGNVVLTIDPQRAADRLPGDVPSATTPARWSRSARRPARSWPWCPRRPSTRTRSSSHNVDTQQQDWAKLSTAKPTGADQPGDRPDLPAGLDVQARRHRRRAAARLHPGQPVDRGANHHPGRAPTPRWRTSPARRAAPARQRRSRTRWRAPATPRSPTSPASSARARCASRRRPSASVSPNVGRSRCGWPRRASARSRTPPSLQQSGIGQRDVRLTPLQNAMIVATIANGGQRMAPHLVKEIQAADLATVDSTAPDRLGRAIPSGVASTITEHDDRGRGTHPGRREDPRGPDRLQDRHRRARRDAEGDPAAQLVRRVRPGRTTRRWRSRCWWRAAATAAWRPPAGRWPPRSGAR